MDVVSSRPKLFAIIETEDLVQLLQTAPVACLLRPLHQVRLKARNSSQYHATSEKIRKKTPQRREISFSISSKYPAEILRCSSAEL